MLKIGESKIEEIQKALSFCGLKFAGGTVDCKKGKAYVILDQVAEVTYESERVAEVLMKILDVRTIVLDGEKFSL